MTPINVHLTVLPDVPCPYLPGRTETLQAVIASSIDGNTYRAFLDAGFRRSGRMIYQPVCLGCRACIPLRVPVREFTPSASQRRCRKQNADLRVTDAPPKLTDEKIDLYDRYVTQWHGRAEEADPETLEQFLYDSPTESIEFEYRDAANRLLAVGMCDYSPMSLSSVYFYFDPAESKRGLGTFGALYELAWCFEFEILHYYLGYWVEGCDAMSYKSRFRPNERLDEAGHWVRQEI